MRRLFAVAGATSILINPMAAKAQREGITFPREGEVCDQVG